MQIQIALCDDKPSCHAATKKLLAEYAQKTSLFSYTLSCFSSGEELLDYIDANHPFDIYILDIIMPDINGIRLGTALHYLLKPIEKSQFFQCMDKAVNLSYVTEVTKKDMVLTGNHLVPIPRRTYETVKSKWADYWLNKGDTHAI